MSSNLRHDIEVLFFKARDEYIAAIRSHAEALAAALHSEALDVIAEYERAGEELERKREAYRQATEDVRAVSSPESA